MATSEQLTSVIERLAAERTAAAHAGQWEEIAALDQRLRQFRRMLLKTRGAELTDYTAIRRSWRQQRRCMACGVKVSKVVLCSHCRQRLAYCPDCHALYPRRASLPARSSSEHCQECVTRLSQERRGGGTMAAYNVRRGKRKAALLPKLIDLYRAGQSFDEIGLAMGLTFRQVAVLIRDARASDTWPAELRRYRRKKV